MAFASLTSDHDEDVAHFTSRRNGNMDWTLCDDAWTQIFAYLPAFDLHSMGAVNKRFRELSSMIDLWRTHLGNLPEQEGNTYDDNLRQRWANEEGKRILAMDHMTSWGEKMHWSNACLTPFRCSFYLLLPCLSIFLTFLGSIVLVVYYTMDPTSLAFEVLSYVGIGLFGVALCLWVCNWVFRFIDETWAGCCVSLPLRKAERLREQVVVGKDVVSTALTDIYKTDWKKSNGHLMWRYFQPSLMAVNTGCILVPVGLLCMFLYQYIGANVAFVFLGSFLLLVLLYLTYMIGCTWGLTPRKKFLAESAGDYMIWYRLLLFVLYCFICPWFCILTFSFSMTALGYTNGWSYYAIPVMIPVWLGCCCLYCWCYSCVCFGFCASQELVPSDAFFEMECWKKDDDLKGLAVGGGIVCCCLVPFVVAGTLAVTMSLPAWAAMIPAIVGTCCGCCYFSIFAAFVTRQFSLCDYKTLMWFNPGE